MGKGATIIKRLHPNNVIYNKKIVGDPLFPNKHFVIVPLCGWEDEDRFFYLSQQEEGIEVMGESYIMSKKDAVETCKNIKEEVDLVKFHVTNPSGESLSRKDAIDFLRETLGNNYSQVYVHNKK